MDELDAVQEDTNLDEVYEARMATRREQALLEELSSIEQGDSVPEDPQAAQVETNGTGASGSWSVPNETWPQSIARNLSPLEFLGGALDAFDENFNTIRKLSEGGNKYLMETVGIPGMIVGEDGSVSFTNDAEMLNATRDFGDMLPDIGDPQKKGLARGIGQFSANYIVLGKALKAANILQGGTAARIANEALRSAVSTFAGFEGMDNPVNALVDAFPNLEGQITEFLDSDQEDPELVNKLRNGLLDAGVGTALDSTFAVLRAVRDIGKPAKEMLKAGSLVDDAVKQMDEIKGSFKELLGDPDSADFVIRQAPDDMARAAMGEVDSAADDVFINWARIESPDDVKATIQALADADAPNINMARRGVRSNEVTALAADEVNAWDVLKSRRKGQALNAEESLAARNLWVASGRKTMELAQAVKAGGGAQVKISFRKMLAIHAAIQEQVIAARTETARALQQWKIPAGDVVDFSSVYDDMMKQVELDPTTERLAEGLTTLNAMGGMEMADKFVYANGRLGKLAQYGEHAKEMVTQLYYASMLSGIHTQMRNIIGNTGMLGMNVSERKLAHYIGKSLGDEQVAADEAGSMIFGMIQGARDSFRISAKSREVAEAQGRMAGGFIDAIKTGDSGFGIGKVDTGRIGAFSAERLRLDPQSGWGRAMDWLDTATQAPQRGLGAMDEVFKTANYRAEIMAQAHRKVMNEVREGVIEQADAGRRIAELIDSPDELARIAAREQAQLATFTRRPNDTKAWRAMRAISQFPVLGKLVLPFSGTPYNIAVESIERLPIAFLSNKWRADLMAGGARADIALAKMGMGTMFMLASFDLAANGWLTGDMGYGTAERETRSRLGERPMTLKVPSGEGDDEFRTFSFRGLDPLTFSLGLAANTFEILSDDDFEDPNKDYEDVAMAAILALGAQFSSANYMSGASRFFDAISDPKRYGESYFESLFSVASPSILGQASRAMDPTVREANTLFEAVLAKTPWSTSLEPRKDAWGRNLDRQSGLGWLYDVASPVYSDKQDVAPIDKELRDLGMAIGRPNRRATFEGIDVDLKRFPKIWSRYQDLQGHAMTETVDGAPITVNSIGYVSNGKGLLQELNDIVTGNHSFSAIYEMGTEGREGDRAVFIRRIVDTYRKEARRHLVEEFPELRAELSSRADERQTRNFGRPELSLFGN